MNPIVIKTLLAYCLSTFPIKDNPIFSNGPKRLPKNPSDFIILCNWVFGSFLLADEAFPKALGSLESCVVANNNFWRKLFSF